MEVLILRVFIAYALAHLLVNERGPYRLLERLRQLAGVVKLDDATADEMNAYMELTGIGIEEEWPATIATTEVGLMLLCPYCTGLWTMAIAVILTTGQYTWFVFGEFFAAYGVYALLLNLVEVLDGLESFFDKK